MFYGVQVWLDMNTRLHKIYWNIVVTLQAFSYFLLYIASYAYLINYLEIQQDLIVILLIETMLLLMFCEDLNQTNSSQISIERTLCTHNGFIQVFIVWMCESYASQKISLSYLTRK